MEITLYEKMGGAKNKINKSPSGSKQITGVMRSSKDDSNSTFSTKNPAVLVSLSESELNRYTYMKVYGKYYFIDEVTAYDNTMFQIKGSLDVLYTYRSQINQSPIIVNYESDYYNPYIPDNRVLLQPQVKTKTQTANLSGAPHWVIGVNGNFEYEPNKVSVSQAPGTSYYGVTTSQLNAIIQDLYSTSFYEALQENLFNKSTEGLISLTYMPHGLGETGMTVDTIYIGNVPISIGGYAVRLGDGSSFTVPSISITPTHNNFLDYAPYTQVLVNIAGVGNVELDPAIVMGQSIYVKYSGRFYMGDGVATIFRSDGYKISTHPVSMGVQVPVNIESSVGVLMGVGSKAAGVVGAGVGGLIGGPTGALIGGQLAGQVGQWSPTKNSTGGGANSFDSWENTVTLQITTPEKYIDNSLYTNTLNPSGRAGTIQNFTGYLQLSSINPKYLDNPYTDEILSILTLGFIV